MSEVKYTQNSINVGDITRGDSVSIYPRPGDTINLDLEKQELYPQVVDGDIVFNVVKGGVHWSQVVIVGGALLSFSSNPIHMVDMNGQPITTDDILSNAKLEKPKQSAQKESIVPAAVFETFDTNHDKDIVLMATAEAIEAIGAKPLILEDEKIARPGILARTTHPNATQFSSYKDDGTGNYLSSYSSMILQRKDGDTPFFGNTSIEAILKTSVSFLAGGYFETSQFGQFTKLTMFSGGLLAGDGAQLQPILADMSALAAPIYVDARHSGDGNITRNVLISMPEGVVPTLIYIQLSPEAVAAGVHLREYVKDNGDTTGVVDRGNGLFMLKLTGSSNVIVSMVYPEGLPPTPFDMEFKVSYINPSTQKQEVAVVNFELLITEVHNASDLNNSRIVLASNMPGIFLTANDGAFNDVIYGGGAGNIIYSGGGSDVIYAGDGNDVIYSNQGAVSPNGNTKEVIDRYDVVVGDDIIYGAGGNDYINGGGSITGNSLYYSVITGRTVLSLNTDSITVQKFGATSNVGQDTVLNIQYIYLTGGNDSVFVYNLNQPVIYIDGIAGINTMYFNTAAGVIMDMATSNGYIRYTDTNSNTLYTANFTSFVFTPNNDYIYGNLGAGLTMDGGLGSDTIDYSRMNTTQTIGIIYDALAGSVQKSDGNMDVVRNFNTIVGTNRNDTFYGSGYNSMQYIGGGGTDVVYYSRATIGLTFDYTAAASNNPTDLVVRKGGGEDTFMGINEVHASNLNDIFLMGTGTHTLDGWGGSNSIYYQGYTGGGITYTQNSNGGSVDSVMRAGGGGTDTLYRINTIYGTNQDDTFILDMSRSVTINGQGGQNSLSFQATTPSAGNLGVTIDLAASAAYTATTRITFRNFTTIYGSAGNDVFIIDPATTGITYTLYGGGGTDFISYERFRANGIRVDLTVADVITVENIDTGAPIGNPNNIFDIIGIRGTVLSDVFYSGNWSNFAFDGNGNINTRAQINLPTTSIFNVSGNLLTYEGIAPIAGVGITIDITAGSVDKGAGRTDTFSNMQIFVGTTGNDTVRANATSSYIYDLNTGNNVLDYAAAGINGIQVDFAVNSVRKSGIYQDTFYGVGTINGSSLGGDVFILSSNRTINGQTVMLDGLGGQNVISFQNLGTSNNVFLLTLSTQTITVGGNTTTFQWNETNNAGFIGTLQNDIFIASMETSQFYNGYGNSVAGTYDLVDYSQGATTQGIVVNAPSSTVTKFSSVGVQQEDRVLNMQGYVGTNFSDTFYVSSSTEYIDGTSTTGNNILSMLFLNDRTSIYFTDNASNGGTISMINNNNTLEFHNIDTIVGASQTTTFYIGTQTNFTNNTAANPFTIQGGAGIAIVDFGNSTRAITLDNNQRTADWGTGQQFFQLQGVDAVYFSASNATNANRVNMDMTVGTGIQWYGRGSNNIADYAAYTSAVVVALNPDITGSVEITGTTTGSTDSFYGFQSIYLTTGNDTVYITPYNVVGLTIFGGGDTSATSYLGDEVNYQRITGGQGLTFGNGILQGMPNLSNVSLVNFYKVVGSNNNDTFYFTNFTNLPYQYYSGGGGANNVIDFSLTVGNGIQARLLYSITAGMVNPYEVTIGTNTIYMDRIQTIYGTNSDDTYFMDSMGSHTIYGTGGTNTLNYTAAGNGIVVDYSNRTVNKAIGRDAFDVNVSTIIGSTHSDIFLLNINGNSGGAVFTIDGNGFDVGTSGNVIFLNTAIGQTLVYSVVTGIVSIDGDTGAAARYNISNIQSFQGGAGNETFYSSMLPNFNGISFGGGGGINTLSYQQSTGGSITVDFSRSSVVGSNGTTQEFSAIQIVYGTTGSDTFFMARDAGFTVYGGGGADNVSYERVVDTGIIATISGATNAWMSVRRINVLNVTDTIYDVQTIYGTSGDDRFILTNGATTTNVDIFGGGGINYISFELNTTGYTLNEATQADVSDPIRNIAGYFLTAYNDVVLGTTDRSFTVNMYLGQNTLYYNTASMIGFVAIDATQQSMILADKFRDVAGTILGGQDTIINADVIYGSNSGNTFSVNQNNAGMSIYGGVGVNIDNTVTAASSPTNVTAIILDGGDIDMFFNNNAANQRTYYNINAIVGSSLNDNFFLQDGTSGKTYNIDGGGVAGLGGFDTMFLSGTNAVFDASQGTYQFGNVSYMFTNINGVVGTTGNDTFYGTDADNFYFDGNQGNNTLDYRNLNGGIAITFIGASGGIIGKSGFTDTFYNMSVIYGTNQNDTVSLSTTSTRQITVYGGNGNDAVDLSSFSLGNTIYLTQGFTFNTAYGGRYELFQFTDVLLGSASSDNRTVYVGGNTSFVIFVADNNTAYTTTIDYNSNTGTSAPIVNMNISETGVNTVLRRDGTNTYTAEDVIYGAGSYNTGNTDSTVNIADRNNGYTINLQNGVNSLSYTSMAGMGNVPMNGVYFTLLAPAAGVNRLQVMKGVNATVQDIITSTSTTNTITGTVYNDTLTLSSNAGTGRTSSAFNIDFGNSTPVPGVSGGDTLTFDTNSMAGLVIIYDGTTLQYSNNAGGQGNFDINNSYSIGLTGIDVIYLSNGTNSYRGPLNNITIYGGAGDDTVFIQAPGAVVFNLTTSTADNSNIPTFDPSIEFVGLTDENDIIFLDGTRNGVPGVAIDGGGGTDTFYADNAYFANNNAAILNTNFLWNGQRGTVTITAYYTGAVVPDAYTMKNVEAFYLTDGNDIIDLGRNTSYTNIGDSVQYIFGGGGTNTVYLSNGGTSIAMNRGYNRGIVQVASVDNIIGGSGNDTVYINDRGHVGNNPGDLAAIGSARLTLLDGGAGNNTIGTTMYAQRYETGYLGIQPIIDSLPQGQIINFQTFSLGGGDDIIGFQELIEFTDALYAYTNNPIHGDGRLMNFSGGVGGFDVIYGTQGVDVFNFNTIQMNVIDFSSIYLFAGADTLYMDSQYFSNFDGQVNGGRSGGDGRFDTQVDTFYTSNVSNIAGITIYLDRAPPVATNTIYATEFEELYAQNMGAIGYTIYASTTNRRQYIQAEGNSTLNIYGNTADRTNGWQAGIAIATAPSATGYISDSSNYWFIVGQAQTINITLQTNTGAGAFINYSNHMANNIAPIINIYNSQNISTGASGNVIALSNFVAGANAGYAMRAGTVINFVNATTVENARLQLYQPGTVTAPTAANATLYLTGVQLLGLNRLTSVYTLYIDDGATWINKKLMWESTPTGFQAFYVRGTAMSIYQGGTWLSNAPSNARGLYSTTVNRFEMLAGVGSTTTVGTIYDDGLVTNFNAARLYVAADGVYLRDGGGNSNRSANLVFRTSTPAFNLGVGITNSQAGYYVNNVNLMQIDNQGSNTIYYTQATKTGATRWLFGNNNATSALTATVYQTGTQMVNGTTFMFRSTNSTGYFHFETAATNLYFNAGVGTGTTNANGILIATSNDFSLTGTTNIYYYASQNITNTRVNFSSTQVTRIYATGASTNPTAGGNYINVYLDANINNLDATHRIVNTANPGTSTVNRSIWTKGTENIYVEAGNWIINVDQNTVRTITQASTRLTGTTVNLNTTMPTANPLLIDYSMGGSADRAMLNVNVIANGALQQGAIIRTHYGSDINVNSSGNNFTVYMGNLAFNDNYLLATNTVTINNSNNNYVRVIRMSNGVQDKVALKSNTGLYIIAEAIETDRLPGTISVFNSWTVVGNNSIYARNALTLETSAPNGGVVPHIVISDFTHGYIADAKGVASRAQGGEIFLLNPGNSTSRVKLGGSGTGQTGDSDEPAQLVIRSGGVNMQEISSLQKISFGGWVGYTLYNGSVGGSPTYSYILTGTNNANNADRVRVHGVGSPGFGTVGATGRNFLVASEYGYNTEVKFSMNSVTVYGGVLHVGGYGKSPAKWDTSNLSDTAYTAGIKDFGNIYLYGPDTVSGLWTKQTTLSIYNNDVNTGALVRGINNAMNTAVKYTVNSNPAHVYVSIGAGIYSNPGNGPNGNVSSGSTTAQGSIRDNSGSRAHTNIVGVHEIDLRAGSVTSTYLGSSNQAVRYIGRNNTPVDVSIAPKTALYIYATPNNNDTFTVYYNGSVAAGTNRGTISLQSGAGQGQATYRGFSNVTAVAIDVNDVSFTSNRTIDSYDFNRFITLGIAYEQALLGSDFNMAAYVARATEDFYILTGGRDDTSGKITVGRDNQWTASNIRFVLNLTDNAFYYDKYIGNTKGGRDTFDNVVNVYFYTHQVVQFIYDKFTVSSNMEGKDYVLNATMGIDATFAAARTGLQASLHEGIIAIGADTFTINNMISLTATHFNDVIDLTGAGHNTNYNMVINTLNGNDTFYYDGGLYNNITVYAGLGDNTLFLGKSGLQIISYTMGQDVIQDGSRSLTIHDAQLVNTVEATYTVDGNGVFSLLTDATTTLNIRNDMVKLNIEGTGDLILDYRHITYKGINVNLNEMGNVEHVYGTNFNDTFTMELHSGFRLDGGKGIDTLILTGSVNVYDLINGVNGIETIDLRQMSQDTLLMSASDMMTMALDSTLDGDLSFIVKDIHQLSVLDDSNFYVTYVDKGGYYDFVITSIHDPNMIKHIKVGIG